MSAAHLLLAAALLAPLHVTDVAHQPVVRARVVFVDAAGRTEVERTDARGDAIPRAGFVPVRAEISSGDALVRTPYTGAALTVTLAAPALSPIGSVRVATGSVASLHRLPVPAAVLDATALAGLPAASTDALLRTLPGVDRDRSNAPFTNYGQVRVSFGGAGTDRGLVLVDGIPAQDAFGGQVDWAAYPPAFVERAELVRGATSALYGSGAIGGVLELRTIAPPAPRGAFAGVAGVALGNQGYGGTDVVLRGSLGGATSAVLATSAAQQAYHAIAPSNASPIDGTSRSQSDATALRVRATTGALTLGANVLQASDTQNEGRPNYAVARNLGQYAVDATLAAGATLGTLRAFARETSVVNIADQTPAQPGTLRYVQRVDTSETGLALAVTTTGRAHTLDARADLRDVHGASDQRGPGGVPQALGSGAQMRAGAALQATWQGRRFDLLAGARYDDVSFTNGRAARNGPFLPARNDAAVSPRAALHVDLGDRLALRMSAGNAFRAPFLNELVRGYAIGATTYAPEPALVPERSGNVAAGVDVVAGRARFALDAMRTTVANAIGFRTVSATVQQRANVGATRSDSLTASATGDLGTCARLRGGATLQRPIVADGTPATRGKVLPYVPTRSAFVALDALGRGALAYGIDVTYSGPTFADDLNRQPLGTAVTVGLHATLRSPGGVEWSFGLENASDARVLSSIDRYAPPRRASTRLRVPFGPAAERRASEPPGACLG